MSSEILDLSADEVEMIVGAGSTERPVEVEDYDNYPIVINNPP